MLCGTDLSEAADVALREADRQARLQGAELVVVHALPATPGAPMFPHRVERALVDRERLSKEVIEVILERVGRITGRAPEQARVLVDEGPAEEILLAQARALGAGLIVVGSVGGSGLRRLLLGSVADRVVRGAEIPVLVTRPSPATGRVLVATDFSAPSEAAADAAAEEARRRGAFLLVAHSVEIVGGELAVGEPAAVPPTAFRVLPLEEVRAATRARLEEALARLAVPGEAVVTTGPAAAALVRLAGERQAELVVVGTRGHTRLGRLLLGSVAEAVVRDAPCSVLVVRRAG